MKLHNYPKEFNSLINVTAKSLNLQNHFVEKDYWITFILLKLSQSEYRENFIFKGGTALSKAYTVIERFSEDIDLALYLPEATGNQRKKIIDKTSKEITKDLKEVFMDEVTSKGSRFRRTVHEYPKTFSKLYPDQTTEKIIVEINSFTQPKNYGYSQINSYIGDFLKKSKQDEFIDQFELKEFGLYVLGLERTLTEKIFSLVRASYGEKGQEELKKKIRHIYDIYKILQIENMKMFVESNEFFEILLQTRKDDSLNKDFYGDWINKPLLESLLFNDSNELWKNLSKVYEGEFSSLVYGDLPNISEVRKCINTLSLRLKEFDKSYMKVL